MLTIRLPSATRRRIELFARRDSRSLSQAAERLIELGLDATSSTAGEVREASPPTAMKLRANARTASSRRASQGASGRAGTSAAGLAGSLAGGLVPTLDDFRAVRRELGEAIARRTRAGAKPRR